MKLGSRSRSGIQSESNPETKDVNEGIAKQMVEGSTKGASTNMSLGLRSRSSGTHGTSSTKNRKAEIGDAKSMGSRSRSMRSTSKGPEEGGAKTAEANSEPTDQMDEVEKKEKPSSEVEGTALPEDANEREGPPTSGDDADNNEQDIISLKSPSTISKRSVKSKHSVSSKHSAISKRSTKSNHPPAVEDSEAEKEEKTTEQEKESDLEADVKQEAPDAEKDLATTSVLTGIMTSMGLSQPADGDVVTKESAVEEKSVKPAPSVVESVKPAPSAAESKSIKAAPSAAEGSVAKSEKLAQHTAKKSGTPSTPKKGFLSKFTKSGKKSAMLVSPRKMKVKNSKDERSKADDSKSEKEEKKTSRASNTKANTVVPPPIDENKEEAAPQATSSPNVQADDAGKATTNEPTLIEAQSTTKQEEENIPLMMSTLSTHPTALSEMDYKGPVIVSKNSVKENLTKIPSKENVDGSNDVQADANHDAAVAQEKNSQEQSNTEQTNETSRNLQEGEVSEANQTESHNDDVYSVAEQSMTYISDVASQVSANVTQSLMNVQNALSPIMHKSSAQCGSNVKSTEGGLTSDSILDTVEAGLSTGLDKVDEGCRGIRSVEIGFGGWFSGGGTKSETDAVVSRSAGTEGNQVTTSGNTATLNVDGRVADTSDPENLNIFVTLPKKHLQRAVNVNIALVAARSSFRNTMDSVRGTYSNAESDVNYEGSGMASIAKGLSRILTGKSEDEKETENPVQSVASPIAEDAAEEVEITNAESKENDKSLSNKSKSGGSKSLKQKLLGKSSSGSQA